MADKVERFPIQRVTKEGKEDTEDIVTKELPLTIILNKRELVTLLCSPADLNYLAIGFLFSEGLLNSRDEISEIVVDDQNGVVRVGIKEGGQPESELTFRQLVTLGCGRGASFYSLADVQSQAKVESQIKIPAVAVLALVKEFQHRSQVYRTTGGVHSAALCDTRRILVFSEDIGRHNAIDKVFGECILADIPIADRIVITSGRVSSEILLKVVRGSIPILISKSAPTNLGVRLASELGITLIGFARGERMNVYSHGWRVVAGKPQVNNR